MKFLIIKYKCSNRTVFRFILCTYESGSWKHERKYVENLRTDPLENHERLQEFNEQDAYK